MKKLRSTGNLLGSLVLFAVLGCAFEQKGEIDLPYKEAVSSVLISADDQTLVVMTAKFHYIFDVPAPLKQTLRGSFHPYVQAEFSRFHVDPQGLTTGTISLVLSKAPPSAVEAAISAGYQKISDGAVFSTTLHGTRYSAGTIQPTAQYRLNKTYEIDVVAQTYGTKATPIGVAAGEFALGALILTSLPVALLSSH